MNGGVWTLRTPDLRAPPPPPIAKPPAVEPRPRPRPRRDWHNSRDALAAAQRLAEAPSSAPLPSLKRAARLARELGLDPATLFTDGDELPSMLFSAARSRRDWNFCAGLPRLLRVAAGRCPSSRASRRRRSRAMRGEATESLRQTRCQLRRGVRRRGGGPLLTGAAPAGGGAAVRGACRVRRARGAATAPATRRTRAAPWLASASRGRGWRSATLYGCVRGGSGGTVVWEMMNVKLSSESRVVVTVVRVAVRLEGRRWLAATSESSDLVVRVVTRVRRVARLLFSSIRIQAPNGTPTLFPSLTLCTHDICRDTRPCLPALLA